MAYAPAKIPAVGMSQGYSKKSLPGAKAPAQPTKGIEALGEPGLPGFVL